MNIQVTFNEGRCFFNGLNQINDIDPQTKKAGINYYRVIAIIGYLLEKLGFAKGIQCFENDMPKIVYVNCKSFLKWRERHSTDEYLTFSSTLHDDEYTAKKRQEVLKFGEDFEGTIKFIIQSYITLSYDEVLKKANLELPEEKEKQIKIQRIKGKLDECKYKESYEMKKRPYIYLDECDKDDGFFRTLPGIRIFCERTVSLLYNN